MRSNSENSASLVDSFFSYGKSNGIDTSRDSLSTCTSAAQSSHARIVKYKLVLELSDKGLFMYGKG
jgi:hypothetical protein